MKKTIVKLGHEKFLLLKNRSNMRRYVYRKSHQKFLMYRKGQQEEGRVQYWSSELLSHIAIKYLLCKERHESLMT